MQTEVELRKAKAAQTRQLLVEKKQAAAKAKADIEKKQQKAEVVHQQPADPLQEAKLEKLKAAKRRRLEADEQKKAQATKAAEQARSEEEAARRSGEESKQKEEELRKRRELEERRRAEQHALLAIRRAIQKVQVATPENFADAAKEMTQVLEQDLGKISAQMQQRMKDEGDKILEQAKKRVAQLTDIRRKKEERRQEEEKHRRQAEDHAMTLASELTGRIELAEAKAAKLEPLVQSLQHDSEITAVGVERIGDAVEQAYLETKAALKLCTDFILSRGPEMQDPAPAELGAPPSQLKLMLAKLLQRINDCTKLGEAALAAASELQEVAVRRASARARTLNMKATFDKYDKDQDNMLSRKEVVMYAMGEFDFIVSQETLEDIFRHHCEDGDRGIRMEQLHYVKMAIGIEREVHRDKQRKADRLAYETELRLLEVSLRDRILGAIKMVEAADVEVLRVDKMVQPLRTLARTLQPSEIEALADTTSSAIKAAQLRFAEAEENIRKLTIGFQQRFEADLRAHVNREAKPWLMWLGRMGLRLIRAENLCRRFRERALKKVDDTEAIALVTVCDNNDAALQENVEPSQGEDQKDATSSDARVPSPSEATAS